MTTTSAFPEGPNGHPRAARGFRRAGIALISTAISAALAAGGLIQPINRTITVTITLAAVVLAFAGLAALALAAQLAPQPARQEPQPTRQQVIADLQALLAELLAQDPSDGRVAEMQLILTGLAINPHQPELIAQAHRRLALEGRRALPGSEVAAPLAIR